MHMDVTFRFRATEALRRIFAAGSVMFVHDEGVYLVSMNEPAPREEIRPLTGNLGLEPGVGDDFVASLEGIEIPANAEWLLIRAVDEDVEISFLLASEESS